MKAWIDDDGRAILERPKLGRLVFCANEQFSPTEKNKKNQEKNGHSKNLVGFIINSFSNSNFRSPKMCGVVANVTRTNGTRSKIDLYNISICYSKIESFGKNKNVKVTYVSIDELIPSKLNPPWRIPTALMNESVSEEGIRTAIEVLPNKNGKYEILDGHRRWQSAKKEGLKDVPVSIQFESDELDWGKSERDKNPPRGVDWLYSYCASNGNVRNVPTKILNQIKKCERIYGGIGGIESWLISRRLRPSVAFWVELVCRKFRDECIEPVPEKMIGIWLAKI
ncbi:ParB/RepB/Spo0J family partition protein [bacterium]|nr:ParB/RepB/Spo0J family partition protein [bacterium]